MNITGFRSCVRGWSFLKESTIAARTSAWSNKDEPLRGVLPGDGAVVTGAGVSRMADIFGKSDELERAPALHEEVVHDRPERQGWEEVESTDDQDDADKQSRER